MNARWQAVFPSGPRADWVVPMAFPNRHMNARPASVVGQAGHYLSSTTSPIGAGTWPAILGAAHCAVDGADSLLAGAREAYALCRPPGHHAYADVGAGFCYVNNAAVAAHRLAAALGRVAILDIDVHHGDGVEEAFYNCDRVLTLSFHQYDEATNFFPGTGNFDSIGRDEGIYTAVNVPLKPGCDSDTFVHIFERVFDRAFRVFQPQAIFM